MHQRQNTGRNKALSKMRVYFTLHKYHIDIPSTAFTGKNKQDGAVS